VVAVSELAAPPPEEVPAPQESSRSDRGTTLAEARRVLAGHLRPEGLRVSPLGADWSRDVDAYVTALPSDALLRNAGWLPLEGLLTRLGHDGRGCWTVVADGRVVGKVDLHVADPPDPVGHVLARCRRDGAGPRELAELAHLRAHGYAVPARPPGRSPLRTLRAVVGTAVRPLRRATGPRLVVAVSGVDGAGKSTLTEGLRGALERVGVPHDQVWVRPGMVSPLVDGLVRLLKRATGRSARPGLRAAAQGKASRLPSRRGLLGRVWLTVVMVEFAVAVRRRHLGSRGVVVFDRHRRDAEITLRLFYAADAGSAAVRWARRILPPADLDVHLDVPAEVSLARKSEDVIGQWAVESQLALYDELLSGPERPVVLDATRPADDLVLDVFERLTRAGGR
jgi:thymidylate kinase